MDTNVADANDVDTNDADTIYVDVEERKRDEKNTISQKSPPSLIFSSVIG